MPLAILAGLAACSGEAAQETRDLDRRRVVRGDLRLTVREQGEIQAAQNTRVTSGLEGRSTVIFLIPEGSIVDEGDRLVELDVSGIEDKRANQAITVAKADAALEQARKNLEIMERQLQASEEASQSALTIAEMRQVKFLGRVSTVQAPADGSEVGTNAQMVSKLRDLLSSELMGNAAAEVNYADLVNEVVEIFGEADNLHLQMGEMANQVLRQIEQIAQARAKLTIDEETFGYSKDLHKRQFITKNELDRDRLTYEGQVSNVMLAWNDLELLIRFTLKENLISLRQDVQNAMLDLDSVRATNEATRVREEAELLSKDAEFELATERLENWEEQIQNAIIRAPTPGLVVYAQSGDMMGRSRNPIMEGMEVHERQAIINLPDVTKMVVELKVHEAEVNQVAVGQPTTVKVDAFSERVMTGRVTKVANIADSGSMFMNTDLKVYKTSVELDGRNEDGSLRPGMSADVEIHVGVLEDVLMAPLAALKRQGEVHYVWKVGPAGPVAQPVEVGINNLTHLEIRSGLQEGDEVYTATPEGIEVPEFAQPERDEALPDAPVLTGEAMDAAGARGAGGSRGSRGSQGSRGGMGGMGDMGATMQRIREHLLSALPQYREQLSDETGWFGLMRDQEFMAALAGAMQSAPADLRASWESMQGMMGGRGGGRGGDGRRGGRR